MNGVNPRIAFGTPKLKPDSNDSNHGQTLANRTKPGPSLQVDKWLCLCYLLMFLLSKTA